MEGPHTSSTQSSTKVQETRHGKNNAKVTIPGPVITPKAVISGHYASCELGSAEQVDIDATGLPEIACVLIFYLYNHDERIEI